MLETFIMSEVLNLEYNKVQLPCGQNLEQTYFPQKSGLLLDHILMGVVVAVRCCSSIIVWNPLMKLNFLSVQLSLNTLSEPGLYKAQRGPKFWFIFIQKVSRVDIISL